jgi:hypothetical protein
MINYTVRNVGLKKSFEELMNNFTGKANVFPKKISGAYNSSFILNENVMIDLIIVSLKMSQIRDAEACEEFIFTYNKANSNRTSFYPFVEYTIISDCLGRIEGGFSKVKIVMDKYTDVIIYNSGNVEISLKRIPNQMEELLGNVNGTSVEEILARINAIKNFIYENMSVIFNDEAPIELKYIEIHKTVLMPPDINLLNYIMFIKAYAPKSYQFYDNGNAREQQSSVYIRNKNKDIELIIYDKGKEIKENPVAGSNYKDFDFEFNIYRAEIKIKHNRMIESIFDGNDLRCITEEKIKSVYHKLVKKFIVQSFNEYQKETDKEMEKIFSATYWGPDCKWLGIVEQHINNFEKKVPLYLSDREMEYYVNTFMDKDKKVKTKQHLSEKKYNEGYFSGKPLNLVLNFIRKLYIETNESIEVRYGFNSKDIK